MGLLSRRRSSLVEQLETDLAGLHTRRDLLTRQLAKSEQELDAATAARQVRLLEADDLDAPHESPVIERLRDERGATLTALSTLAGRIAEAESRLTAERDLALRSAAAKELAVKADALDRAAGEAASALAKVPAVLDDVLNRLPLPHLVEKANLKAFSDAIVEALRARRQYRLYAVLRHRARLFREHARRQHHQSQAVPLGPFHS
jgi:hypothetical protein